MTASATPSNWNASIGCRSGVQDRLQYETGKRKLLGTTTKS